MMQTNSQHKPDYHRGLVDSLTTETTMIALAHISPSHHLPPDHTNGFPFAVLLHVPSSWMCEYKLPLKIVISMSVYH